MNHRASSRCPSRGDLTSLLLAATFALLLAGCEKPREKVYRLGYIGPQSEAVSPWIAQAIREQLRDDGFIEAKNLVIDWHWTEGKPERIRFPSSEASRL